MTARQEDDNTSNTAFPNPPIYWQSFSPANIAAYDALQTETEDAIQKDIPEDLKNLRPPTPPANGEYGIFGENRALNDVLKGLPEETASLLPAEGVTSSPQHLLNLTRSLMLSYLELLHIMAIDPEPPVYGIKWEDLRDLFKNAHHGLNTYRPWQAKESLIQLLEQTRDNARAEIQGVQNLKIKVDTVLQDVARNCEHIIIGSEGRPDKVAEMTNGAHGSRQEGRIRNGLEHDSNGTDQSLWWLINEDTEE